MSRLGKAIALGVLLVLVVLGGGWFLLVAPARDEAAALRVQADQQQAANTRARTQLQVLQAQADGLPAQQARLAEVSVKIPATARVARLINALTAAAEEGDVEFVSLVPGVPTPVAVGPSGTATATSPSGTATATSDPSGPGAPPAAGTAAEQPRGGAAGTLHALPLTINVVGGYYQLERYLVALEELPRALRVTGLTVTPGPNPVAAPTGTDEVAAGESLAAVITGEVYLALDRTPLPDPGVPVGTGASGPATGGAGAPTPVGPGGASRATAPGSVPDESVD